MKTCGYCGRDNGDDALACRECGTELVDPQAGSPPAPPRDWSWFEHAVRYVGAFGILLLVYLLSLGPVMRFCATTTTATPPLPPPTITTTAVTRTGTTLTMGPMVTAVRTVSYPRWVGVVYYPAFSLVGHSSAEFSLGGLYLRYLQWWE